MAFEVSILAERLSTREVIEPQIILEIDGLPLIGASKVTKLLTYGFPGAEYGGEGLVYGGVIEDEESRDYIDLSKSTQALTQQLLQDKGGSSSVTKFKLTLVDYQKEVSEWITPGLVLDDILAKKARVYLAFQGGAHPRDSILIFNGIVGSVDAGPGFIEFNIDSPEQLKRAEIFPKYSSKLTASINKPATTLPIEDESGFIVSTDSPTLRTYVRIDDEIIQYTTTASGQLLSCTRGALGTSPENHDSGADVESFYRLTGNLRDLALKILLSGTRDALYPETPVEIVSFETNGIETIDNAMFFNHPNIQEYLGLFEGDFITVTGATIPANNVTAATITGFGQTDTGSYLVVGSSLSLELDTAAVAQFKSQYNTLPVGAGVGMYPDQVDVAEHVDIFTRFSANFFDYDFFLRDSVKASDFINTEIYYPSGCYSIPRKGRSSIGTTTPPVAGDRTVKLSDTNVVEANRIKVSRSISNNFYNAVVYKYDELALEERFITGKIRISADSTNRIKVATKPLEIVSKGIRSAAEVENKIQNMSRRFLDRYQYGSESFEVQCRFREGWNVEVGDTVIMDGRNLQMTDTQGAKGTRVFLPRIMEVSNKSLNIRTGEVKLKLTDTAFELDGRYGGIGPSSVIAAGSLANRLILERSYGTPLTFRPETYKWEPFIGEAAIVHDEDWTVSYPVTLGIFDESIPNSIFVDGLPVVPSPGWILDQPKYPTDPDPELNSLWKAVHCSFNPQLEVATGISVTQFTVSPSDALKIIPGHVIQVHNEDYSIVSSEVDVEDVTGVTITLADPIEFTPSAGQSVDLLGYLDGGRPYRWL